MSIRFLFRWYDFYIGFYYQRWSGRLYVFPIPMFGFVVKIAKGEEEK